MIATSPRAMVPNAPTRGRFLMLAERHGRDRVARALAQAAGWDQRQAPRLQVRGVEVALGLVEDRFGATRRLIRAYRVAQFAEAMDALDAERAA